MMDKLNVSKPIDIPKPSGHAVKPISALTIALSTHHQK